MQIKSQDHVYTIYISIVKRMPRKFHKNLDMFCSLFHFFFISTASSTVYFSNPKRNSEPRSPPIRSTEASSRTSRRLLNLARQLLNLTLVSSTDVGTVVSLFVVLICYLPSTSHPIVCLAFKFWPLNRPSKMFNKIAD